MLSAVELIITEFVVVAAICFLLLRYYAAALVSADIRYLTLPYLHDLNLTQLTAAIRQV